LCLWEIALNCTDTGSKLLVTIRVIVNLFRPSAIRHRLLSYFLIFCVQRATCCYRWFRVLMRCKGAWPDHHCRLPNGSLPNESIPLTDDGSYDSCKLFVEGDRNKTTECSEWQYDYGIIGHTISSKVTQSQQLCQKVNCQQ